MRIKGIGPRNLGAPKSVAKQTADSKGSEYPDLPPNQTPLGELPSYPQRSRGLTQYVNDPDLSLYNRETDNFQPIALTGLDSIYAMENFPNKAIHNSKKFKWQVELDKKVKARKADADEANENLEEDRALNNRYGGRGAKVGSFNKKLGNYTNPLVFTANQREEIDADLDEKLLSDYDKRKLKRFKSKKIK